MSKQSELSSYIEQLQQRLRLGAWVRGAAILTAAALFTTVVLVMILNHYAFPLHALTGARLALIFVLALTGAAAIAWPVMRLSRRRSVSMVEAASPELEQRLVTFEEKKEEEHPFLELLAADTLSVAHKNGAVPETLVPRERLLALAGAGAGCLV